MVGRNVKGEEGIRGELLEISRNVKKIFGDMVVFVTTPFVWIVNLLKYLFEIIFVNGYKNVRRTFRKFKFGTANIKLEFKLIALNFWKAIVELFSVPVKFFVWVFRTVIFFLHDIFWMSLRKVRGGYQFIFSRMHLQNVDSVVNLKLDKKRTRVPSKNAFIENLQVAMVVIWHMLVNVVMFPIRGGVLLLRDITSLFVNVFNGVQNILVRMSASFSQTLIVLGEIFIKGYYIVGSPVVLVKKAYVLIVLLSGSVVQRVRGIAGFDSISEDRESIIDRSYTNDIVVEHEELSNVKRNSLEVKKSKLEKLAEKLDKELEGNVARGINWSKVVPDVEIVTPSKVKCVRVTAKERLSRRFAKLEKEAISDERWGTRLAILNDELENVDNRMKWQKNRPDIDLNADSAVLDNKSNVKNTERMDKIRESVVKKLDTWDSRLEKLDIELNRIELITRKTDAEQKMIQRKENFLISFGKKLFGK